MKTLIGLLVCLGVVVVLMPGHDPNAVSLLNAMQPPSAQHWLGTDSLGRDVLARLIEGGKISLLFAAITVVFAGILGTIIGLIAGLCGGGVDRLLMRLCDAVIALPLLPFLIVLSAIDPAALGLGDTGGQTRLMMLTLVIAAFAWPGVARLCRAGAQSTRKTDYVMAARALGVSPLRIALRHILPVVAAPVIVALTLATGQVILLESTLSFLGLGLQPPTASWGTMLNNAQNTIWSQPLLAVWPGLAIAATVMGVNLLGDRLRDRMDPYYALKVAGSGS